jgi:hypothetical protein
MSGERKRDLLLSNSLAISIVVGENNSSAVPSTAYQGATLMNILVSAACALLLLGSGASAQTLDDLKKDGNGGSTDNTQRIATAS